MYFYFLRLLSMISCGCKIRRLLLTLLYFAEAKSDEFRWQTATVLYFLLPLGQRSFLEPLLTALVLASFQCPTFSRKTHGHPASHRRHLNTGVHPKNPQPYSRDPLNRVFVERAPVPKPPANQYRVNTPHASVDGPTSKTTSRFRLPEAGVR